MKRTTKTAALGLLSLAALAMSTPANAATASLPDRTFMMNVSQANMAEVQAGMLAQKMGSPSVQMLGKHLADDHTMNQSKLAAMAKSWNVMLPMHPMPADVAAAAKLKTLHGAAFDSAYLSMEQKDHMKNIAAFKKEAAMTTNPTLKTYANATIPVLEEHLQMATDDAGKMHGMTGSGMKSGSMGSGAMGNGSSSNGSMSNGSTSNGSMGSSTNLNSGKSSSSGGIDGTPSSNGAGGSGTVNRNAAPMSSSTPMTTTPAGGGQPGTPGSKGAGGSSNSSTGAATSGSTTGTNMNATPVPAASGAASTNSSVGGGQPGTPSSKGAGGSGTPAPLGSPASK